MSERRIYAMQQEDGSLVSMCGIPVIGSRAYCCGYRGTNPWRIVEVRVVVVPPPGAGGAGL